MKIEKKNKNDERKILTAMIVDDTVLARIATKWKKKGLFKTKWANLVAGWCIKYHTRYEKAPRHTIENLFEAWSSKVDGEENVRLIEKFLDSLSGEYKELKRQSNSDYIIDLAGKYFNKVQLESLAERIEGDLEMGRDDDANERVIQFNQIELGAGHFIEPFQDESAIEEAFKSKQKPLIKYPGALGKFLQGAFERDGFISFMAPEKRGKTWFLIDATFRAIEQHRKVAFFEAGDMSQNQIMRRLMTRVSKTPSKRSRVKYPISIYRNTGDKQATVDVKNRTYKTGLKLKEAKRACKKFIKNTLKDGSPFFRLSCYPNSTLKISMIKNQLDLWAQNDWVPDVIVVDYMDILDVSHPNFEGRDCINEAWKQMRSISQKYHCLVVTASQTSASSYDAPLLTRKHFSEDKRKLSHVTGVLGINQNRVEEEMNVYRLNWIELREGESTENEVCYLAACLSLGNPCVKSCR